LDDGDTFLRRKTVGHEDVAHFFRLRFGHGDNLLLLASLLICIMLGITTRREIAAQSHRDGAGGNFREACGDDEMRLRDSTGKSRGESKRNGQPVRHPDDDVSDSVACGEVFLNMWSHWHSLEKEHGRFAEIYCRTLSSHIWAAPSGSVKPALVWTRHPVSESL